MAIFNCYVSSPEGKYLMRSSSLWCWSGGPLAPSGLTRSFWRLLLQCKSPGRLTATSGNVPPKKPWEPTTIHQNDQFWKGAKPHNSKIMAPATVFHLRTDPFVGEFQALAQTATGLCCIELFNPSWSAQEIEVLRVFMAAGCLKQLDLAIQRPSLLAISMCPPVGLATRWFQI